MIPYFIEYKTPTNISQSKNKKKHANISRT